MIRELTGMRCSSTERMSISASSRRPHARLPSSSAALDRVLPPADHIFSLEPPGCCGTGVGKGDEALTNPDIGALLRGLSYKPNASNSTMHTFEKFSRRWL